MRRGLVAVLLFCACLTVYFYIGRPDPKVDYLAALNRTALQTPVAQRAWPDYRQAILAIGRPDWPAFLSESPDGPNWLKSLALISAHREAVALIRRGAEQRSLGFVLGPRGSIEDPPLYPRRPRSDKLLLDAADWRFLTDLRALAMVLALDAKAARQAGDAPRLMSDITALLGMAGQLRSSTATLMESLAGVNIDYLAVEQSDATLARTPTLLSDAQLQELADRLGHWTTASDFLRLSGDRLIFLDLLQHVYTDNGAGDGRMTPEGWLRIRLSYADPNFVDFVAGPLALLRMASRQQALNKYDQLMAIKEAELHLPARDAVGEADRQQVRHDSHPDQLSTEFGVITTSFSNPYIGGSEILLGDRDGVVIGIALERYRRGHGEYPGSLELLVPQFLAAVPVDRITGSAVKYLLRDGKPLVYSVGADRVDNAGTPGVGMWGPAPDIAALWPPMQIVIPGDWILYPHTK